MNNALTPRQIFNQQREAARATSQNAYRAAMQMQDVAKRQEAKAAAQSAYKDAVDQARQAFNVARGNVPKEDGKVKMFKKGGLVKKGKSGGAVRSSASKRGDGCAIRGKTKGRIL